MGDGELFNRLYIQDTFISTVRANGKFAIESSKSCQHGPKCGSTNRKSYKHDPKNAVTGRGLGEHTFWGNCLFLFSFLVAPSRSLLEPVGRWPWGEKSICISC